MNPTTQARTLQLPPEGAHALPVDAVLDATQSGREGLTHAEAVRRLAVHGPNALLHVAPVSAARVLWDQCRSTVVALLVVAALVGAAMGETAEATAILAVLVVNVGIGFTTEWRARAAVDALRKADAHPACVRRDGAERRIDARDVVPGDLLDLDAGEAVTADARVIESSELRVVEAALTGESQPVAKSTPPVERDTPLAERSSMVLKGTMVAAGTGRAVVVATGARTEIGEVGRLVTETSTDDTPLERRLAVLGRQLIVVAIGLAALVAVVGIAQDADPLLMVQTGIALAIAAVPEGLPVVATICLALGMHRMAQRRALVRRLPAVETLGSITVVCTDKTGTLTAGEMTVTEIHAAGARHRVTGAGYAPDGSVLLDDEAVLPAQSDALHRLLRIAALANEATLRRSGDDWTITGDPTEAALLTAAHKAGLDPDALGAARPRVAEIPFSSDRMWMGSARERADGVVELLVKGAPGRVLERCDRRLGPQGEEPLAAQGGAELGRVADALAERGLRVLAFADRVLDGARDAGPDDARGLVHVGFVGMLDPPADGVREAVAALRSAGVRPVMITGDHRLTATAVARDLEIAGPHDATLGERDLQRLGDEELADAVRHVPVFSRVSPHGKLRIVAALRAAGEVVGMLGDGVNDAPALKKADIGVAMGRRGTDVAKETAGLVLADDRFDTVVAAVEEGRVIFDNILKFIFFLFSCNVSEVLILFCGAAAGLPVPLAPLQILWLNFVTDVFPALALAAEPGESDVLCRPPRDPAEAVLSRRFVGSVALHAAVLTIAALLAFACAQIADPGDQARAQTMTFMAVALGQTLHALNARSPEPILFGRRLLDNPWMWGAFALVGALQAAALAIPFLRDLLGLVPLSGTDWAIVGATSLLPLAFGQALRWTRSRRRS